MGDNRLYTVKEFAELSRTTRDILHHYDKIGLLSPAARGANKYRYYSNDQLGTVNVIRTMQKLGMTLLEIQELNISRTPQSMDEVFSAQAEKIDGRMQAWVAAGKLLCLLRDVVRSGLNAEESAITIRYLPAEAIMLGPLNDYSGGRDDYDALASFYLHFQSKLPTVALNYPVWGVFTQERITTGDWVWPDRYYFFNPEGYDRRPAALYAVGYARGGYGRGGVLYDRMIEYIKANGFEICGNAYEEYPFNELSMSDPADYLIRLLITVREKAVAG